MRGPLRFGGRRAAETESTTAQPAALEASFDLRHTLLAGWLAAGLPAAVVYDGRPPDGRLGKSISGQVTAQQFALGSGATVQGVIFFASPNAVLDVRHTGRERGGRQRRECAVD
jgi:hypothetical protein